MFSTPLLRRAELFAPVRCRTSTALISSAPGAKISAVGMRFDGLYRPRRIPMVKTIASSSSSPLSSPQLRFRRGNASDVSTLFKLVLNEKMLPFGLHPERFIIAEEEEEEGGRSHLVAFGQLAELESNDDRALFELRSLVTVPEFRGKGIGAEIVRRLSEEAAARKKESKKKEARVIMTTISRRVPFYRRLGFSVVSPPPKELSFEIAIGSVVAKVAVGDSIVAMGKEV